MGRNEKKQLSLVVYPILLKGFYTSQVVQDFFHQQYVHGTAAINNKQLVCFVPRSGGGEYYLSIHLCILGTLIAPQKEIIVSQSSFSSFRIFSYFPIVNQKHGCIFPNRLTGFLFTWRIIPISEVLSNFHLYPPGNSHIHLIKHI